ncbi:MAG: hypothetical protein IPK83_17595 [Planctomycetes bacterium]|nr:hypothetical protein [Planctomycetota bacterium]
MKNAAQIAKEAESTYLGGVSANLKTTGSRIISGQWFQREEADHGERVRAAMVDRRIYDREKFNELPQGRTVTIRGYERRWIFGKRVKSVTIATVMAPPGPLLDEESKGATPPPISRAQLMDHISNLISDAKATHLIGVCSPSGFETEILDHPPILPNVKLVLVAPREDGGWRVTPGDSRIDPRLIKLFDPEEVTQKLSRVKREIDERRIDLLTGTLSAGTLARELDLPVVLVNNAFEQYARSDPELRVSKVGAEATLYRGAAKVKAEEDRSMSLADWIRSLFSKDGEELKKINVLAEKRIALHAPRSQVRRHRRPGKERGQAARRWQSVHVHRDQASNGRTDRPDAQGHLPLQHECVDSQQANQCHQHAHSQPRTCPDRQPCIAAVHGRIDRSRGERRGNSRTARGQRRSGQQP